MNEDSLTALGAHAADIAGRPIDTPAIAPVPPLESLPVADLPPMGLVLAGGGAKGGYQVGAVRCLVDLGVRVSAFSGTSIGALNVAVLAGAPDLATGADRLATAWREVTSTVSRESPRELPFGPEMDQAELPHSSSLLAGLRSPVLQKGFIESIVAQHVGPVAWPTWVATFPAVNPELTSHRWAWVIDGVRAALGIECEMVPLHERNIADARIAVLASAALPVFFAPRKLDGRLYRDGGYRDNTPALPLVAKTRLDPILVVHLSTGRRWDSEGFGDRGILEVRPEVPLSEPGARGAGAGLVDFSAERFAKLYRRGYTDTHRKLQLWLEARAAAQRMRTALHRAVKTVDDLDRPTKE